MFLPQILFVFGLKNYGVLQSKMLVVKHNMGTSDCGSDYYPRASEDQWKNIKFDHSQN